MNDAARWRRVERVLDEALAAAPAEWAAVLDARCDGDAELRAEVESLLGRVTSARQFLDAPPAAAAAAVIAERVRPAADEVGRRIGAYRVLREIGRGGMSRVFLAERADGAFAQRVALKLLRPELDSEVDEVRFRAERQILARLNHPNIARLLDGGVTDDGRPFLVLEHVQGETIDRYCAARALGVARRLELFVTVAEATQYAHRNLVVHRDLKPANILVTGERAADAQVKLLDFGLAKLLDAEHAPASPTSYAAPTTRGGRRWMTPEYAAPEQIRGDPVTTVTDVYQLGAVLYELLADRVPFGARAGSLHALEDAVLRDDVPPPSSTAGDERTRRALRGDLDAIVAKAMRKEPDRRYASAEELADDVRRHLAGHPVRARGRHTAYRLRRFARRHRAGIAAAAAIVALSGAYVGTVIVGRARIERALAEATLGTRKAEQVTDFMLGLFEASESGRVLSDSVTARDLLSRGLARARELSGQPELQAQMLDVIGRLYTQLGDFDAARPPIEEALATRRRLRGESHADVATSLENLANVHAGKQRVGDAIRLRRQALALRRALGGETDPKAVDAVYALATVLHQAGNVRDADPLFDRWLSLVVRRPGDASPARAAQLSGAATLLHYRGDFARAEPLYREALAAKRAFYGARNPAVTSSLLELGGALGGEGRHDEADTLLADAVSILRAAYPQGHPALADALRSRAIARGQARRYAEAEPLMREAHALFRRFRGADAIDVGIASLDLAFVLNASDRHAEAETLSRDALRIYRAHFGDDAAMVARAHTHLGNALRGQGRLAEAEPMLLRAYDRLRNGSGITGPWRSDVLRALVALYGAAGRPADAARYRALLTPE